MHKKIITIKENVVEIPFHETKAQLFGTYIETKDIRWLIKEDSRTYKRITNNLFLKYVTPQEQEHIAMYYYGSVVRQEALLDTDIDFLFVFDGEQISKTRIDTIYSNIVNDLNKQGILQGEGGKIFDRIS